MNGLKPQSSITWDEPRLQVPPIPHINIEKSENEGREEELGTPRKGRSRHRSSSSVTFKGKEKELSIHQQRELAQRQPNSAVDKLTTEPFKTNESVQPNFEPTDLGTRSPTLEVNYDKGPLSPIQPLTPLNDSIRRTIHEDSDNSIRVARLADWVPDAAGQAEGDLSTGRASRGNKEQE